MMAGCSLPIRLSANKPDPVDVHLNEACYAPCTESALPITASPDSAVLSAITEHEYRKQCEVRRQACVQALKRGMDAGVIK